MQSSLADLTRQSDGRHLDLMLRNRFRGAPRKLSGHLVVILAKTVNRAGSYGTRRGPQTWEPSRAALTRFPPPCLGLPAVAGSRSVSWAASLGCCSSSVVEHSLGKGEVESSILSCSTIIFIINPTDRPDEDLRVWCGLVRGAAPGQHQHAYFVRLKSVETAAMGTSPNRPGGVRTRTAFACAPFRTKFGCPNFQYSSCQVYEPRG